MNILLISDAHPEGLFNIQCLMQRLVQKYKECHICLMAPQTIHSLARRLEHLDELLVLPDMTMPLKYFWIAGRQLETWQFDQAIILTHNWKPALIPWMAGVSRRTGYLGRLRLITVNDARWLSRKNVPCETTQYVALADDHGEAVQEFTQPRLIADKTNAQALIKEHYLESERPVAVFCPGGTARQNQKWPASQWAQLAIELIDQGWTIRLIAPQADQEFCEQICASLDREQQMEIANLAGRLAWEDMVDLMASGRVTVTLNNIFASIVQALEQPLVVLSGASEFQPDDKDASEQRSVSSDRSCQPCDQTECQRIRNRTITVPCMEELSVDRVRSSILSMVPVQEVD